MFLSSAPRRVAHVAYSLRTGGMERLLVEFARHHDRSTTDLHFYCLTEEGRPGIDIREVGCPVTTLHKREGFRLSAVWQLQNLFRRDRIEVVHSHNSGAMIYGALAGRAMGAKAIVHTRHGQRFGASRRQTMTFAQMTRLVDRVVTVSQDGADQSIREGIRASRVRTIWNGIDLARFRFHGNRPRRPAILVARMVPEKDLPTLLEAVELVVRRDPTFRLRLAGDGPALADAKLRAERAALGEHVEFLGERRDIADLLADSSLFILSSRTEGISLTLLEAMASGLPVVATKVGGNSEVVEDGLTGLLVPSADPNALAEAILRLWQSPDEATAMGVAGRRRVEEHFQIDVMIHAYETLYEEIVAHRHKRARNSRREKSAC